ncbi:MAG: flagellar biosynthesis protein FlhB [Candidatus Eremiobacteraeota bacterium]|nr:flagellar biosynthesis protein FlhB [Candidatus Eremiobacteraeota bacterium]
MPKPEQTEQATPKRREEARGRGQVAKSTDLTGAIIFLVAVFVLHGSLVQAISGMGWTMQITLNHLNAHQELNVFSVWGLFVTAMGGIWMLLALLFMTAIVVGVLGNVLQFGFLVSGKTITPNFTKINPITGFKRLFSKQVIINLLKQFAKLGAVFVIIYASVVGNISMFYTLASAPPMTLLGYMNDLIYGIGWKFGVLLVVLGFADYLWQKHELEQSLKMTKQEVKDEWKQREGNAEAKGAFKRRQREMSRRRMMSAVPKATVVVTNPTHFAIALEWDELQMEAPVVTAKGADLMAKRIRKIALQNNVPIMENPPLARTLYAQVEIDEAVPPNLYAAVAQVIAFVFKLKRKTG